MSKDDLVVVGIGSSAGGLEALQTMLSNLGEVDNCAFVIAQHLSPTHKSMMVDLLSRTTNIPVIEVKNALKIKAKTIYMTPENTDICVKNGKLFLKTLEQSFGPKPSVNYFFSSLARDFKENAIGIILSGTGSDGAHGIRAIKAEGGITIAQAPTTAKYDGMPFSAINTGKVDLVVSIEKLGSEISDIVASLDEKLELSVNDRILQQIYRLLFNEFGVDFSLYKKNTLIRRIERRLAALKLKSLQEYIKILSDSNDELNNLYHDILIGVTAFFRDKEAFEKLEAQIKTIMSKKEQGEEIRFWSIGCSTGEEAYSVAILLSEILKEKISKYKIKIFATDIDDESLKIARTGIYPETSFEGVDKEIIKKYFTVQKNHFEIKKSLRELVIFSKHNIISDSPFLRLDLITCRNMLIYFSNDLQNKFFPIIHYALRDNGILFLGKSESIGQHIDLFSLIDKSSKIFKAQFTGIKEPPKLYNYSSGYKKAELIESNSLKIRNEEEFLESVVTDALKEVLLKSCVVVNSSNDIVYIKGDIPYIKPREGKISNNIFKLLNDDISLDLRNALNKSSKGKTVQTTQFRSVILFEDIVRYVRLIVTPIKDEKSDDWLYTIFFQSEESHDIKENIVYEGNENELIQKLTQELDSTKSHLQNVIEELETSYEEMQSLNEELQSSNEELQSSNEELETTNEELQSTNEELQTAYSELRVLYEDKDKRAKQLEELTSKLGNKTEEYRKQKEITELILNTAPIAITMVDNHGKLTFANDFALELFDISKSEILNRTYDSKEWKIKTFSGEDFLEEELPFFVIKRTFEPIYNVNQSIQRGNKRIFLSVSGSPQFDFDGNFQGAVFCIENLTENHTLQNNISQYEQRLSHKNKNLFENSSLSLFETSLLDINSSIRNLLGELSLQLNSIEGNEKELTLGNKKINLISSILEEKINFYTNDIHFKEESLFNSVNSFLNSFDNEIIYCKNRVKNHSEKIVGVKKLYENMYGIFDFYVKLSTGLGLNTVSLELSEKDVKGISYLVIKSNIKINTKDEISFLNKLLEVFSFKFDYSYKEQLTISIQI
ncbi:hypothetical protein CRV01_02365 [Arcobacter sp. CECT 8983]|uniref:CheR family methyltransferase n=1 Tax=Arcobacter sp. CECT 8983 TaxID=2044508 RepID=UPI00100BB23E|nr:CheR family methyltransferase [Arcobacter sp. CECT 8983]RXJ91141.1 hypothetical protein CRV01_02365 [Arcobacter sp. CECT 8983]